MAQTMPTCGFLTDAAERKLTEVPVLYADKPGRNRNLYPKEELIKAVDYYNKLIEVDPTYKYIFIKHPKDEDEEWLGLVAGSIDRLYFDDNDNMIKMDCTLLPTIWGQFVGWLLDHGYVVGTSVRGTADKTQSTYDLNGKQIPILIRTNFRLEGVDFVVYPSFITTHADKENVKEKAASPLSEAEFEKVLESFSKEAGVNIQEILEQEEVNMQREDIKKTDLSPEELERLKLQLELYETKYDTIKEKVSQLQEKEKTLREAIQKLEDERKASTEELDTKVRVVSDLESRLNKVKEQYESQTKQLEELEKLIAEKKEELERIEEAIRRKHRAAVVNCCGKTFDENNPPKIRIVPVEEEVSDSPWGEVDKDVVRKLVWLTGDKELANKVFGVVDWTGWTYFKYPVYQPVKSKEKGYDVDLVLNRYGLAKALAYMLGRGSVGLNRQQKKHLVQFLYDKYAELQKQGLAKIPESLAKLAKRLKVMEKVEFTPDSDEFASAVFESALLHGIVDIEGIEQLADDEKIQIQASPELAGQFVLNLMGNEESGDSVSEAVDKSKIPSKDEIIAMLIGSGDNLTDFAKKYDLSSPDDFTNLFSDADDNDVDILNKFKDALYAYLGQVLESPDDAIAVIDPLFNLFNEYLQQAVQGNEEEGGENNSGEATEEKCKKKKTKTVKEQTSEDDQPFDEHTNTEDEEGDEVFEQLKQFLESHFEGVTVESPEDAMELIKKLASDYADVYAQLQKLEFERVKEAKVKELLDMGVDESIIDEELADIEDEETLEKTVEKIKNILSKVKESKSKNAIDPLQFRKSKSSVKDDDASGEDELFNKMMNLV